MGTTLVLFLFFFVKQKTAYEMRIRDWSSDVCSSDLATVDAAAALASALSADCTVAIGGGSTIGLAKALSLRLDLPSLVVPTTYAGSEVTPIWGLTQDGVKTTGRDRKVLPKVVIYDPDLP